MGAGAGGGGASITPAADENRSVQGRDAKVKSSLAEPDSVR